MADGGLRIGLQVWGQYVSWDELMSIGADIDALGFEELWSNDHFMPLAAGTDGADGAPSLLDDPVVRFAAKTFGGQPRRVEGDTAF